MGLISEATTEIQIRFVDLDAYNHVNNAVYQSYLEIARLPLVKDVFLEDMAKNIQYLLVKIELNYKQPVKYTDRLLVHCWFSEMKGARFKISYLLHNGAGKIFADGYTLHALYDANAQKPMRIPDEWKQFVKGNNDEKNC